MSVSVQYTGCEQKLDGFNGAHALLQSLEGELQSGFPPWVLVGCSHALYIPVGSEADDITARVLH